MEYIVQARVMTHVEVRVNSDRAQTAEDVAKAIIRRDHTNLVYVEITRVTEAP